MMAPDAAMEKYEKDSSSASRCFLRIDNRNEIDTNYHEPVIEERYTSFEYGKTFYQEFKYLFPYSEAVSVPIRVTGTITVTSGPIIISYSLSAFIDNPGVEAYFISNPYFYQSGSHIYMTYNIRARCGFATQDSELQTVMVY
ncbi:MAG: hypothetical protein ACI4WR_10090 [Bulleidia sp.]